MILTINKTDKDYVSLHDDGLLTVTCPCCYEVPNLMEGIKELVFGEGIAAVEGFACCKDLRKVVFSDTMLAIKGNAFCSCESLEEISVPATMSALDEYAFTDCFNIKRVVVRNDEYLGFYDDETPPVVFALRHTTWAVQNKDNDVVLVTEDGKRSWKLVTERASEQTSCRADNSTNRQKLYVQLRPEQIGSSAEDFIRANQCEIERQANAFLDSGRQFSHSVEGSPAMHFSDANEPLKEKWRRVVTTDYSSLMRNMIIEKKYSTADAKKAVSSIFMVTFSEKGPITRGSNKEPLSKEDIEFLKSEGYTDQEIEDVKNDVREIMKKRAADKGAILTNNEYYKLESELLKKNGLIEPEMPDDDASDESTDEWYESMKEFIKRRQELCADLRERRQLGAYKVSNGEAEGDAILPPEWTLECNYR